MSGVDDGYATVRAGLHTLYAYTSDLANPPGGGRSETYAESVTALNELAAESVALRNALEKYAVHKSSCPFPFRRDGRDACTCGLNDVLLLSRSESSPVVSGTREGDTE